MLLNFYKKLDEKAFTCTKGYHAKMQSDTTGRRKDEMRSIAALLPGVFA
jgi:hypothetical protein